MPDILFLSIFHLLGGAAVGAAIRRLITRQGGWLFVLVWGLGFGGIPLFIGYQTWREGGAWLTFAVELAVFFGAIGIAAFVPRDFISTFSEAPVMAALMGGIFFLVGSAVTLWSLANDVGFTTVMGLIFAATGAALAIGTLRSELKKERSDGG